MEVVGACGVVGFFPYAPRPFQEVATAVVRETAEKGGHAVLEMPTGSGKTVVLLAGALEAARRSGKRVLYVSRTNSQQEQTVREFNAILSHSGEPIRALALQGRSRLCLKLEESEDPEWRDATPEELSHFCGAAKNATDRDAQSAAACSYFSRLKDTTTEALREFFGAQAHTAEWLKGAARTAGLCPYEATKRAMPEADVVIAPYLFALEGGLRRRLLEWWGVAEKDLILVVDEAHNVPEYVRELHSPRLTKEKLRRALLEAHELGNPEVLRAVRAQDLLTTLAAILERCVAEYCRDEDGFIPPFEVEGALLEAFSTTTGALREACKALSQLGEILKDRRRLLGRIPRSHLSHVAGFLEHWLDSDEEGYVKLAGREPAPYLEAYLVDAARAGESLLSFHATIHASGTLDPLEEYRDSLGLPEATRLERFPSPFPPDLLSVRVVQGVTSRFEELTKDPLSVDRLQEATRQLVEAAPVSAACFFTSHRMLRDFREIGVFARTRRPPLFEERGVDQEELMGLVAAHRGAAGDSLLVGVLGGRLSEGLDFPGRQLEAVFVVGLPYPKPTAHQRALFHYHEVRWSRGWDYAVRAPALRRLRQALGRLVRSDADRGFAVILDERAGPLLRSAGVAAQDATLPSILHEFATWSGRTVDMLK